MKFKLNQASCILSYRPTRVSTSLFWLSIVDEQTTTNDSNLFITFHDSMDLLRVGKTSGVFSLVVSHTEAVKWWLCLGI